MLSSLNAAYVISTGRTFLEHVGGSDSEAKGSEKDRQEVIIEPEELMVESDDIVAFAGFPIFRSFRRSSSGSGRDRGLP